MVKVSIIGATGYAGAELLRLLYNHPQVEVVHITSESYTGKAISEVYPHLRGLYDQKLISMKDKGKGESVSWLTFFCRTYLRNNSYSDV